MRFIAGFIAALIVLALAGLLYMYSGAYNVAASVPDPKFMDWILGTTMQRSDSSQNAIRAMAELARGIDGLVKHIRAEQADLRIHIEEQGDTNRKLRELIEAMLREDTSAGGRPN